MTSKRDIKKKLKNAFKEYQKIKLPEIKFFEIAQGIDETEKDYKKRYLEYINS